MNKIKSNPYKTILTISLGFFVVFLVWKTKWALLTGLLISLLGLINLRLAKLIEKIWFKIANILGFFVPNIVLTGVFYFFLFPLALFSSFFRKKEYLDLRKQKESHYQLVNKKFTKESFLNPW